MAKDPIGRLLSVSSPSLFGHDAVVSEVIDRSSFALAAELSSVLALRNGFFAFEGALRLFPSRSVPISYGIDEWNSNELWRFEYENLVADEIFFAEDIFGGQFCLRDAGVFSFDPETAEFEFVGESIAEWASLLLTDYEVMTGFLAGQAWQRKNGKLPGRHRLVPKVPFVLGGDYSSENLSSLDSARGMIVRGNLARQIYSLPEGTRVRYDIEP